MLGAALTAAKVAQAAPKLRELKKACDGIESAFLKQMLGAMHRANDAIKGSDELTDKTGEGEYKDMMDNALADRLADRGTIGISKLTFHATAARVLEERPKASEKKHEAPLANDQTKAPAGQALPLQEESLSGENSGKVATP